jgi:hypothetical protein
MQVKLAHYSLLVAVTLLLSRTCGFSQEAPRSSGPSSCRVQQADGTQLDAQWVKFVGTQVYVRLLDGRMVAYERDEVTVTPTGNTAAKAGEQRKEPEPPVIHSGHLSSVAATVKLPEQSRDGISLTGERAVENSDPQAPPQLTIEDPDSQAQPDLMTGISNAEVDLPQPASNIQEQEATISDYEQRLQYLAAVHYELSATHKKVEQVCSGGQYVGGGGSFIAVSRYGGASIGAFNFDGVANNATSPVCKSVWADCFRLRDDFIAGFEELAGLARKNKVLPGEARRLKDYYGLNFKYDKEDMEKSYCNFTFFL